MKFTRFIRQYPKSSLLIVFAGMFKILDYKKDYLIDVYINNNLDLLKLNNEDEADIFKKFELESDVYNFYINTKLIP